MRRILPALLLALGSATAQAAQPQPAQPQATQPPAGHPQGAAQRPAAAPPLKGKVLEWKDADPYTYLRLKTANGEVWAAVMKAPVKVGAEVTVLDPMTMKDFRSNTLGRTFDTIVFGTLAGAAPAASGMPGGSPHGAASAAPTAQVAKVEKATGADARTVAELYAQRKAMAGKPVAVRGQVVKVTANVMGKNWVHLRDGSGAAGTNDLVVTTKQVVMVGDVVTARGTVRTDVDIGMGMTYPVVVEDAKLTK